MSKLRCCHQGATIGFCEHTVATARLGKYRAHLALRARRSKLLRTINTAQDVETLRRAVVSFLVERKL